MSDMRHRIENELGLEPNFQVIDTQREGNVDTMTRYEVYDAEMTLVCQCEDEAFALLIHDLLEQAV